MKIFILLMALLATGCATNGSGSPSESGFNTAEQIAERNRLAREDAAHRAAVRNWIRSDLIRIEERKLVINDMLKSEEISYEKYFLLMDQCIEERRTILDRLPQSLRKQ